MNYVVDSYGTPVEFIGYLRKMPEPEIRVLQRLIERDLLGPPVARDAAEIQMLRNRLELLEAELEARDQEAEEGAA